MENRIFVSGNGSRLDAQRLVGHAQSAECCAQLLWRQCFTITVKVALGVSDDLPLFRQQLRRIRPQDPYLAVIGCPSVLCGQRRREKQKQAEHQSLGHWMLVPHKSNNYIIRRLAEPTKTRHKASHLQPSA